MKKFEYSLGFNNFPVIGFMNRTLPLMDFKEIKLLLATNNK